MQNIFISLAAPFLGSQCNSSWLNSFSFCISFLLLLPFYHVLKYVLKSYCILYIIYTKSHPQPPVAHLQSRSWLLVTDSRDKTFKLYIFIFKGHQLGMQSRPAFNRFRRPAGDGGGMHQALPNLRRHPSHRLHLCSLGGWAGPGHLHPLQGTLCQLHRPLSTPVRASRHFGLLSGSP